MMNEHDKLFAEFPPVTIAEWEAKIQADLKGADYEKKLLRKTLENITVKPYYTAADLEGKAYLDQQPGVFPFARGSRAAGNNWEIRQDFSVADTDAVIARALLAAGNGVDALGLDFTGKGDLYYHDVKKLIAAVYAKNRSLNLVAGESAVTLMEYLQKAFAELGVEGQSVKGSVEFDPLGNLTVTGGFYRSAEEDFADAAHLLQTAAETFPHMRVLAVNSHLFCDAGASVVQELAYGLSMMAAYLEELTEKKHSVVDIVRHLQWNLGVGSDYFMEIARVRAARQLFSALLSAFGNNEAGKIPVYLNSITTTWNKTLYDRHVNMLRLTTEAMAAVLGGCDSLVVRPFDACCHQPDDISERLARNVQIILKEESYFNKVTDVAAGSYYVESLTHSLVENAWALFLKTSEAGGYVKAFTGGLIQADIKATVSRRAEMVASRREALLGTNQYPNQRETISQQVDEAVAYPSAPASHQAIGEAIPVQRAATGFEQLRLATEKHPGARPKVFMLTIGNLAMRLARAQFSGNFFACAGYEITDNLGFSTAKEGVDAALDAKADIIVVCSSDDEYAQYAPEVATLVGDKAIVVVAGAPACMEELKQKGITEFIHLRSNMLETLRRFSTKLGIA